MIRITVTRSASQADPPSAVDLVISHARREFLTGGRLEMGELAAAAGVNRATLFRWIGGRDRLLGEVIWSITAPTIDRAARDAAGEGATRIANVMGDFAALATIPSGFRSFVRREPQRALRVMTTSAADVQSRIVTRIEELLAGEVEAGRLRTALPLRDLAFLLVRVTEGFVYSDVITGEEPDAEKVRLAAGALLGGAAAPSAAEPDGAGRCPPQAMPERMNDVKRNEDR